MEILSNSHSFESKQASDRSQKVAHPSFSFMEYRLFKSDRTKGNFGNPSKWKSPRSRPRGRKNLKIKARFDLTNRSLVKKKNKKRNFILMGWLVQLSFLMRKATLEGFLIFLFFMYYKWLKHRIEGEMARSVKARSIDKKAQLLFWCKRSGNPKRANRGGKPLVFFWSFLTSFFSFWKAFDLKEKRKRARPRTG